MSSTIPEQRQQSQQQLQQQKQQQQQQLPSSDSEADQEDVGAVVAKAKKAAASLWMIIHAQVRTLLMLHVHHRFVSHMLYLTILIFLASIAAIPRAVYPGMPTWTGSLPPSRMRRNEALIAPYQNLSGRTRI
mmetsp:Transcript_29427/g.59675  ORF Transcript_29427/g.59675 Transcript_29427/m.59675 type:complete len:132 (-) Transcript_29427:111-506(-)